MATPCPHFLQHLPIRRTPSPLFTQKHSSRRTPTPFFTQKHSSRRTPNPLFAKKLSIRRTPTSFFTENLPPRRTPNPFFFQVFKQSRGRGGMTGADFVQANGLVSRSTRPAPLPDKASWRGETLFCFAQMVAAPSRPYTNITRQSR